MRLGKRILFGGIVILAIVALILAIISQFVASSFYEEAWIVWAVGVFLWLVVGLSVDAESSDMIPEEIEEAQASQKRHMVTAIIALAIALLLLLCGLVARSVWKYAETGNINLGNVNIQQANIDNAEIDDAEITNAHINDAEIDNAHIDNAIIDNGIIGAIIGNLTNSGGNSGGSGGSGGSNANTTRPVETPTQGNTQTPTETPTERPTESTTSPREDPPTQAPKLVISAVNYDSYGDPIAYSSDDTITITISGCNILDIDYYWVNSETGAKQKSGVSFVKISEGKYELVIEDWVFESAEDIQIKNPATQNQYYTVTIEHVYS